MKIKRPLILKVMVTIMVVVFLIATSLVMDWMIHYRIPITFSSDGLQRSIADHLDIEPSMITRHAIKELTYLDATGQDIRFLDGLQHAIHLETLILTDNFIADVSPLSALDKLHTLHLRNNEIVDLLDIRFDQITHLEIKDLSLRHNVVRPVSGGQIRLSDLSLLSSMTSLTILELRDNHISDLTFLSTLDQLTYLDIRENRLTDITPLQYLHQLKHLNMRDNQVEDLEPLVNLIHLEYLNIHTNPTIKSIQPIGSLVNLHTMIMAEVPFNEEYDVLGGFIRLVRLNIRNTDMSDASILAKLMSLGALQDDADRNIQANLDLRETPVLDRNDDHLDIIRPYWQNISQRQPEMLP